MEFDDQYFNFFELDGKFNDDLKNKLKETLINHMNQNLKKEDEINPDLVLIFNLEGNDSDLKSGEIIHLCNLIKACDDTIYGIITGKCEGIASLLFLNICPKNRFAFNNTMFILDNTNQFSESIPFRENPDKHIFYNFLKSIIRNTKIKENISSAERLILSNDDMLNYKIIKATFKSFYDLETIEENEDYNDEEEEYDADDYDDDENY